MNSVIKTNKQYHTKARGDSIIRCIPQTQKIELSDLLNHRKQHHRKIQFICNFVTLQDFVRRQRFFSRAVVERLKEGG